MAQTQEAQGSTSVGAFQSGPRTVQRATEKTPIAPAGGFGFSQRPIHAICRSFGVLEHCG